MVKKKKEKGYDAPAVINRDNPRQRPESERGLNAPSGNIPTSTPGSSNKQTYSIGGKEMSREEYGQAKRRAEVEVSTGRPFGETPEKRRQAEITETAQRSIDIGKEKERLQTEEPMGLGDPLLPEDRGEPISTGEELAPGSQINKDAVEIQTIQNKLLQPETGKVLDSINRWRLEIKLDNLQNRTQLGGTLPIGIPTSAVTAAGGSGCSFT